MERIRGELELNFAGELWTASGKENHTDNRMALVVVADGEDLRRVVTVIDRRTVAVAALTQPPLTIETAAALCQQLQQAPDVTILFGGREALSCNGPVELLKTLLPQTKILLVAPGEDRDLVRRALRAGIQGLVAQSRLEALLPAAIRAVGAGQLCIPQTLSTRINVSDFTARENEVLDLITEGLTNAQIARRLFLSESTVKSHLASSFRKLGLCSRAEAASLWSEVQSDEAVAARPTIAELPVRALADQPQRRVLAFAR